MLPFLQAIFTKFHALNETWAQVVNIVTEIDCLASLAIASSSSGIEMTMPDIIPNEGEYEQKTLFDIKSMIHPCVQLQAGKDFIPNDTYINSGQEASENPQSVLLVTGPNMGGKSTILR
mmetsp:Transcript_21387/g.33081  ORF Transcript_21387/g.33081 Transcript_21387/m.33081 type:complete len:119 (+) Transcript_21387:2607-2963(+)